MAISTTDYIATVHNGLFKHTADKTKFLFDFYIGKKRFRKTWTGLPSHTDKDRIKQAYIAMEEFIIYKTQEINLTVSADSTISSYYDTLAADKKSSNSWNSERLYRNKLFFDKYIRDGLGTKKIRDVIPADFTRFNSTLDHLSQRSKKVAYELLIPVFNLAIEDDLIKVSPIKKSHIPKRNQLSEKRIVTDAVTKYRAVHKAIMDVFADNHHHRALFLFGFHGRRLNEVVTMKWEDIDLINGSYVVRGENSKVDTDMQFTLPLDVSEALSHFSDTNGDVFNIKRVETLYQKIRDTSGVEEFSFHWMRNLSVSALSSMGVEATHLSAMLGHTDAGTLRKYLSLQRKQSTSATLEASHMLLAGVTKA
jgi:integrase